MYKIFAVNPGSTSTKLGLFEDEKPIISVKIEHPSHELNRFPKIIDQYPLRKNAMIEFLKKNGVEISSLSAVVGRGGLLKPFPSGTYHVDVKMIEDLSSAKYGEHASNLGALLAFGFEWDYNIPSYVVDPVGVDEMMDIARLSGLKEISRKSQWHALNSRAVVRQVCRNEGWDFKKENFVSAHLGGGITIAALERGRSVDVTNGFDAGPFTPERAGAIPTLELVKICFSGKYDQETILRLLVGKGGLVNYLGTSNLIEIERRIDQGDDYAKMVLNGMAYQVAKEIGGMVAVLCGKVKCIVITGGCAHSKRLVKKIIDHIKCFSAVFVVPGEDELGSLAQGALRVLCGEEIPLEYCKLA
ncbi:butyrate kinase [bacterium]|nr:butyrate kinase [bacterium]